MPQYGSPWEGLLAGLGGGLQQGVQQSFAAGDERRKDKRRAEIERQQAMDLFRQRGAMGAMSDRIGTPQEISEGTAFLGAPEPEQAMVDEFMRGIPAGVTPSLSPTFALASRGREAAMRLPQTSRELGNRPPPRPRPSAPKNFTMEMNRALDTIRENLGPQGRYAPLSPESVRAAAHSLTVTLGRPLTPQEFSALTKAGKQANPSLSRP